MKTKTNIKIKIFLLCINCILIVYYSEAQSLNDFEYKGSVEVNESTVRSNFQFNGYASTTGSSNDHWWNDYRIYIRYGNLFKITIPDLEKKILQCKIDIAEDLKIPGLWMQEGFIKNWLSSSVKILENPAIVDIEAAVKSSNILVLVNPVSESGKILMSKYSGNNDLIQPLKSYQYSDPQLIKVDLFILERNNRKIFVIASKDHNSCLETLKLLENTRAVVKKYDMYKGWFGVETLLKSVTCTPGHPLELIGKGMNEGMSWFVFSGYMEFQTKKELESWISRTRMPIVTDVGASPIFGLNDYEELQVQSRGTRQEQIDFAHKKGGYIFRPVWSTGRAFGSNTDIAYDEDLGQYDAYIATEGNKQYLDTADVPFVVTTGNLVGNLMNSMVLFIDKGEKMTRENVWKSILDKREVAIMSEGLIIGPSVFRTAMQMLLLDRVFLEELFGDRIDLKTEMEGYNLNFTIDNTYSHDISGKLDIQLPAGIISDEALNLPVTIPAKSSATIKIGLRPEASAMNMANPIVAGFQWQGNKKYTMCAMELPPAISVHKLLYGQSPIVKYPVTIHNFTKETSYPVTVRVYDNNKPGKVVFTTSKKISNATGTFNESIFDLKLPAGSFQVEVTALGVTNSSQLGVGKPKGSAHAYEIDLNKDGINEYRLENDSVQITLLRTGARVIEYIVKSRNDNVFFKLWPEKTGDDKRPNRMWQFYPYGGFEDFLGQASMETHRVYDAEMIMSKGSYVQVKMITDYYGNKLEKIFTLFANSPLLEIRFALTFKNPEANMLGPQPLIELGKSHGTEDVFIVPGLGGLEKYIMKPESSYGKAITVKEGWYAGYDSSEDISFIGTYPVDQPIFLHMWMNHPNNSASHYYYVEMQPWTPIYQKSIMYFTCYLWGAGGNWEAALKELRNRNLISVQQNK